MNSAMSTVPVMGGPGFDDPVPEDGLDPEWMPRWIPPPVAGGDPDAMPNPGGGGRPVKRARHLRLRL